MLPNVKIWLTIIITLVVLAGFAALVGYGIYQTWTATATAPSFTDTYLYLATALTGLVGGIVAAGFGQKLPQTAPDAGPGRMARNIVGLGNLVLGGQTVKAKEIVASVYAGAYLVLGLAAIVTWVLKSSVTPDLVKSLAGVATGLFLAIVQTYMSEAQA